jgi:hypothetical protein
VPTKPYCWDAGIAHESGNIAPLIGLLLPGFLFQPAKNSPMTEKIREFDDGKEEEFHPEPARSRGLVKSACLSKMQESGGKRYEDLG